MKKEMNGKKKKKQKQKTAKENTRCTK